MGVFLEESKLCRKSFGIHAVWKRCVDLVEAVLGYEGGVEAWMGGGGARHERVGGRTDLTSARHTAVRALLEIV